MQADDGKPTCLVNEKKDPRDNNGIVYHYGIHCPSIPRLQVQLHFVLLLLSDAFTVKHGLKGNWGKKASHALLKGIQI